MRLELENISKRYDAPDDGEDLWVLRDLSLALTTGESIAVIGPSGSGKSTLLNIMGALDRPTSGRITLDGQDLADASDAHLARVRNEKIGFIFQDHHLLPQCTLWENVLVPTLVKGTTPRARDRAARLIERVGLSERLQHRPGQLSGGERQRVAVVRALVNGPGLLLADEPTGALDRATAHGLIELLEALIREEDVMLVVVTHAQELAARMDRRMELRDQRLQPE